MIENNAVQCKNFSEVYRNITIHVVHYGDIVESRVGRTREVLDFKTSVTNPRQRCVGGSERKINVFFLLAEALWIWAGRNDVEFLKIFNSRMGDYSDNGRSFNAPYGFRLRHYGMDSLNSFLVGEKDDNLRPYEGGGFRMDQMRWVLNLLDQDPDTRRAVITIWNPEFDTKSSKDIPCNDLLMFKIRNGKLHLTIANRSNDLHWGLCTNIFQFSFILEIMAEILGVEVGNQTHNSQSLHIYEDNPITRTMFEADPEQPDFYSMAEESRMNFGFDSSSIDGRLKQTDEIANLIIDSLSEFNRTGEIDFNKIRELPRYFRCIFDILFTYLDYNNSDKSKRSKKQAAQNLLSHFRANRYAVCEDYYLLAVNHFVARLDESDAAEIEKEALLCFENLKQGWLGKF